MANFNLVVNTSNFRPFDIGTSLQVLRDYRDAYYRMENKLEKLQDEQGNIVLPEDSKYKGILDSYTEDFDDFATRFSKGMTRKSASDWTAIRNRYRKEIKPIKDAVDAYNQYVDKWDAISTNDETAIRGYNYSVDDFYGGNRPDIGYRSGKRIEADAIGYFTGLSNALTQDPTFKTILGNQYHQMKTTPGLNSSDALQAALIQYNQVTGGQQSEQVNNILSHMQNLFNSQGAENFTDEAKQQVWNRISSGLMKSIQAPQFQQMQNLNFESDAARSTRLFNQQISRNADRRAEEEHQARMRAYNSPTANGGGNRATVKTSDGSSSAEGNVYQLSDGSYWTESKGKYYRVNPNEDGTYTVDSSAIPMTQAQLVSQDKEYQKKLNPESQFKRSSSGTFTDNDYMTIGQSFEPFEFSMDDFTGSESEKKVKSSGFKTKGSSKFNGASSGMRALHLNEVDLPMVTKQQILSHAQKQVPGLHLEDLDLYVDQDTFSDDEVRVVIRGTGEDGNYVKGSKYINLEQPGAGAGASADVSNTGL